MQALFRQLVPMMLEALLGRVVRRLEDAVGPEDA